MIWDWDLWRAAIPYDAAHAIFDDVSAQLATLTAEVDALMELIGNTLVTALRKAGIGPGL